MGEDAPAHRDDSPGRDVSAGEAAAVCARFDLGLVTAVRPLRRGSDDSPKALLTTTRGTYLLKRRAPAQADDARVELSHRVHTALASAGVPVAPMLRTKADDRTAVRVGDGVFEVFVFVQGERYTGSPRRATPAGPWRSTTPP